MQPVPPPELATNGLHNMFMDSVKHITGAMSHTNIWTNDMRAKAHSMCYPFGNPTWFIIVNSNDGGSIDVWHAATYFLKE